MYHVPLAFQCIYGRSDVVFENGDGKKEREISRGEREWRLPGLLYADDLVLCGESEEDLSAVVGRFIEVCRRRGLKVNACKRKVIVLDGLYRWTTSEVCWVSGELIKSRMQG